MGRRRHRGTKALPGSPAAEKGRTYEQNRKLYEKAKKLLDRRATEPEREQHPTIAPGEGRSWRIPDGSGDGGVTGNTYVSRQAAKTREQHSARWGIAGEARDGQADTPDMA